MVTVFGLLGSAITASVACADAPPHTEMILWHLSTTQIPPAGTHEYCATTQMRPFIPALCFGELPRAVNAQHPDGYVRVQVGAQYYFLRITGLTAWQFMYRTGQYTQNTDVYMRSMRLTNDKGVSSTLNEQFMYYPPQVGPGGVVNDFGMMRTMAVTGSLPDGTAVSLSNIYMFSQ
jgi:hypothetical protein